MIEPLKEWAAPGLTEKCQNLCSAWHQFDGSPKTTAAVGMCIGAIFQSIKTFEQACKEYDNAQKALKMGDFAP